MKGKVLGFDAAGGTGAISGDDGQRYSFTTADFKSPGVAKANDGVDFEVQAGVAKNIYVTAASASVDLSAMAANPAVANILAKPNIIWAAVVILGSLVGGYLSAIQLIGGGPMGMLGMAGFFYSLLFFIPIVAGVLIFFEFTNNAMLPIGRLVAGGLAAGGPIVFPLVGNMFLPGLFGSAMSMAGGGMGNILSAGSIITIAGGVLILLTTFGIIKKLG